MQPNYATNAPQGYLGDWKRGAPMGRPDVGAHIEAKHLRKRRANVESRLEWMREIGEAREAEHVAAQLAKIDAELGALNLAAPLKFTLQRVRLDSGGYDPQGAYWGAGQPLYWAADESGEIELTFRAEDRDDAKAYLRGEYAGAMFYR